MSRDVRGFDGTRVLIPRGSRLIGEYRSDVAAGQNRALVNWTRLIRPDGVTIDIGSPASDPIGGIGIHASVNTHFFARFADAILQSALYTGVGFASRIGSGPVIVAFPGTLQQGVGQTVQPHPGHAHAQRATRNQHQHLRRPRPRFHQRQAAAVSGAAAAERGGVYLRSFLSPLDTILARPEVTDIYVNRPGELWAETIGGAIDRHDVPELDPITLLRLARQIAALSHQGVSREHPLLSATLPDGARVQVVAPPATRGPLALAIRKHVAPDLALADYVATGAFAETRAGDRLRDLEADRALAAQLDAGDIDGMLAAAVRARKNILVSGGTSTGKTTFLNALIREIAPEERLILIEDTPELQVRHENMIGLLAARSGLGEALVTANDLVAASLRMRPDRIILGELRGEEAYAFLRAINTGHPGSMTTVHADSAERAVEQIVLLVLQGGSRLDRDDVRHYVDDDGRYFRPARSPRRPALRPRSRAQSPRRRLTTVFGPARPSPGLREKFRMPLADLRPQGRRLGDV